METTKEGVNKAESTSVQSSSGEPSEKETKLVSSDENQTAQLEDDYEEEEDASLDLQEAVDGWIEELQEIRDDLQMMSVRIYETQILRTYVFLTFDEIYRRTACTC